jgi:uncharacterized protein
VLYVDTSAFLKLIRREPQSAALRSAVNDERLFSSELLLCEALRAAGRYGERLRDAAARAIGAISLVPIDRVLLADAGHLGPTSLRSLDAVHLVTALRAGDRLDGLLTYDGRLTDACRSHSVTVIAPA